MNNLLAVTLSIAILFPAHFTYADDYGSGAVVSCDSKKQQLLVEYHKVMSSVKPRLENSKMVSFWNLLIIEKCSKDDRFPGDPCSVIGIKEENINCSLGKSNYQVTLRPIAFNPNALQGACGAAATGSVSIRKDGNKFLDETYFEEPSCSALYDEKAEIISSISVTQKEKAAHIEKVPNKF
jgi:hypothetical protein